ncbi:unnamed protein product [Trichogramma brassicae]|uniref:Uncharacterized protein n=1 Tax=Trichogramma brassicae TaxID=86971 RepID=A0A6H5IAT2_9HYME|nr:unnamed protein product [Trichogramma brassicae]
MKLPHARDNDAEAKPRRHITCMRVFHFSPATRPKLRANAQIEFKKPMSMLNFCFCSHDPTHILLALLAYSTKCAHQHQHASTFINARRRIVQPMIDQSNRAEKAQDRSILFTSYTVETITDKSPLENSCQELQSENANDQAFLALLKFYRETWYSSVIALRLPLILSFSALCECETSVDCLLRRECSHKTQRNNDGYVVVFPGLTGSPAGNLDTSYMMDGPPGSLMQRPLGDPGYVNQYHYPPEYYGHHL